MSDEYRDSSRKMTPEEALAEQRQYYGATLNVIVQELATTFGLSVAGVCRVLGISHPMMSQLRRGLRHKIGSLEVNRRLVLLRRLRDEVLLGMLDGDEIDRGIERIRHAEGDVLARLAVQKKSTPGTATHQVRDLQRLFWAVASSQEIDRAARALDSCCPQLAELVRVYGLARTSDAVAHYERYLG